MANTKCYYCGRRDGKHDGPCQPEVVNDNEFVIDENFSSYADPTHAMKIPTIVDMLATVDKFREEFGVAEKQVPWYHFERSISIDVESLRDMRMEDLADSMQRYWDKRAEQIMIDWAKAYFSE